MVCDLCNQNHFGGKKVSAEDMRKAVRKGFDISTIPGFGTMGGVFSIDIKESKLYWESTILKTSTTDWMICRKCYPLLKKYL